VSGPVFEGGGVRVFLGDCLEVMRELPDASVHAVVTDPPYGIGVHGHEWDVPARRIRGAAGERGGGRVAHYDHGKSIVTTRPAGTAVRGRNQPVWVRRGARQWARECFRVLKPGGHLLAFGGSRTWHRLAAGVEDAGFELRDSIAWLYGSGFPKSLDVSKAIDAAAGAEREVVGPGQWAAVRGTERGATQGASTVARRAGYNMKAAPDVTAPATDAARQWEGWGTALKPAFEPIVVARKPLVGTVAANVLAHGTGR
jgi:hypothetical protein